MELNVKILKIFDKPSMSKAIASVTFDNSYVVNGIRIIDTGSHRFSAMPSETHKDKDGNDVRREVFHPISSPARKEIDDAVLAAYDAALAEKSATENI